MMDEKVLRNEYITVKEFNEATVVAGAARRAITSALSKHRGMAVEDKDSPALPGDIVEITRRNYLQPQILKVVRIGPGKGPCKITLWGRIKNRRSNKFGRVVVRIYDKDLLTIKKL